ncbi:MAG: hypothetical protein ACK42D_04175 [Candidatus Paceibacteria bacterium]
MDIELIAPAIEAYKMPRPPEAIWYVSADMATLGIAYPFLALTENPKTLTDVVWLPNKAILIIVWAIQTPKEVVELLSDVAGDCGIKINIKIDL